MRKTGQLLERLEQGCARISAAVILMVMLTVTVDVVLRYVFNAPLRWSYDAISIYGLIAVFYLAVGDAYTKQYHLRLDVFYNHFPPRLKAAVNAFGLLASALAIGWLCWINLAEAWRAWTMSLATTGRIAWPIWPMRSMIGLGLVLLTLRLALDVLHNAAVMTGRRPPDPETPAGGH